MTADHTASRLPQPYSVSGTSFAGGPRMSSISCRMLRRDVERHHTLDNRPALRRQLLLIDDRRHRSPAWRPSRLASRGVLVEAPAARDAVYSLQRAAPDLRWLTAQQLTRLLTPR